MPIYAVKQGWQTGKFQTWAECQKAVTGYSGAVFKKFKTEAEADAFLGETPKNDEPLVSGLSIGGKPITGMSMRRGADMVHTEPQVTPEAPPFDIDDTLSCNTGDTPPFDTDDAPPFDVDDKPPFDTDDTPPFDTAPVEPKPVLQKMVRPAEVHKKQTVELYDGEALAYVVGSWNSKRYRYGFAVVFRTREGEVILYGSDSKPRFKDLGSITGNLLGTMYATRYAAENHIERLTIVYGYDGVRKWANNEWSAKREVAKAYAAFMKDYMKTMPVFFISAKDYVGNGEGPKATKMAKLAIERNIPVDTYEVFGSYWNC